MGKQITLNRMQALVFDLPLYWATSARPLCHWLVGRVGRRVLLNVV
jgi:hypothetical protein